MLTRSEREIAEVDRLLAAAGFIDGDLPSRLREALSAIAHTSDLAPGSTSEDVRDPPVDPPATGNRRTVKVLTTRRRGP